jgi:hypothetical protein
MWFGLLPAIVVITVMALVFHSASAPTPPGVFVLSGIVGATLVAITLAMFILTLLSRKEVRDGVVAIDQGLALRVEQDDFVDKKTVDCLHEYAAYLSHREVLKALLAAFQPIAIVPARKNLPLIFITIKPVGKVKAKYRGALIRARGIAQGSWCQVEWDGNPTSTMALIAHEVSHVILSVSGKYDGVRQHELIRMSGVEKMLF